MEIASLIEDLVYDNKKISIKTLLETESSKEIRITFSKGQILKEHKTPFPIIVEVYKGEIAFSVNGSVQNLNAGNLLALEGGVPHSLTALENSIVRLSLSKRDSAERVQNIETT
jgi:quercetin dioxygenase-like cupin family protein